MIFILEEGYLYSLNEWKKSIQFVQDASSEN